MGARHDEAVVFVSPVLVDRRNEHGKRIESTTATIGGPVHRRRAAAAIQTQAVIAQLAAGFFPAAISGFYDFAKGFSAAIKNDGFCGAVFIEGAPSTTPRRRWGEWWKKGSTTVSRVAGPHTQ